MNNPLSSRAGVLPFLFFAAVAAALFPEMIFQGKAFVGGNDRFLGEIPFLRLAVESLSHGRLPQWNDYNMSGCPFASQALIRVLYLPNLLIMKLWPSALIMASSWRLLLEFYLTLCLAYLLFHKVWGERPLAVFSALAYGLSCAMIEQYNGGFIPPYYFPLVLLILWDWPRRSLRRNILFLAPALFLQFVAGMHQYTGYYLIFQFAVAAARGVQIEGPRARTALRLLCVLGVSLAVALLLAAPDLLPFLTARSASNRTIVPYSLYRMWNVQPEIMSLRLILPYFLGDYSIFTSYDGNPNVNAFEAFPAYAGLSTFFFCALSLAKPSRDKAWPWALGLILTALASLGTPFFVLPYLLFAKAPLLHGRLAVLVPVFMAFLSPLGIRAFLDGSRRLQTGALAGILLSAAAAFLAVGARIPAPLRQSFLYFAVAGAALAALLGLRLYAGLGEKRFKIGCVLLLAADLVFMARAHSLRAVFAKPDAWYPASGLTNFLDQLPDKNFYRFSLDRGTPWAAFPTRADMPLSQSYHPDVGIIYGLREVNGYVNFIDARYSQLVGRGAGGLIRTFPEPVVADAAMADILGVKYFVLSAYSPLVENLARFADPVFLAEGAVVFARRRPVPLIHLACRAVRSDGLRRSLELIDSGALDPRKDVLLEPGAATDNDWSVCREGSPGLLEMRKDGPGRWLGRARLDRPALLVLSETFSPGWRAFIDGRPQKILRANEAFQAIELPASDSTVEFRFDPPGVDASLAACMAGLLIWLGLAAAPALGRIFGYAR